MNQRPFKFSQRPRRLRATESLRRLVRETPLSVDDLIMPVFVIAGNNIRRAIPSMPDIFQFSLDRLNQELEALQAAGVTRVILFGIPAAKDATGSDSRQESGIIQQAIRQVKHHYPDLMVISDVCLCEYTDHGHCGIVENGEVQNDLTLSYLQKQAVSHARAGVDMVAPSGMMDGMVAAIRSALDETGFSRLPIMSYSVKYASGFYGPFREAAQSTPRYGDRRGYQMDPANAREALREVELDVAQGADIVMVKPALAYLDIIARIRAEVNIPVACYNVSGEYSMIRAAAEKGWLDLDRTILEIMTAFRRAGADMVITYFARRAAALIRNSG